MPRRRRAVLAALLLSGAALSGGCSDDDDKPLAPGTGEDLETPTSRDTPPEPPNQ